MEGIIAHAGNRPMAAPSTDTYTIAPLPFEILANGEAHAVLGGTTYAIILPGIAGCHRLRLLFGRHQIGRRVEKEYATYESAAAAANEEWRWWFTESGFVKRVSA